MWYTSGMKLIAATFLLVISSLGFAAELVPGLDAYRAKYLAEIEAAPTPAAKDAIHRKVRADLAEWVKKLDTKPVAVDEKQSDKKERELFNKMGIAEIEFIKGPKEAGSGTIKALEFQALNNTQNWQETMAKFKKYKGPLPKWEAQ